MRSLSRYQAANYKIVIEPLPQKGRSRHTLFHPCPSLNRTEKKDAAQGERGEKGKGVGDPEHPLISSSRCELMYK
jgi:hypothetical protein